MADGASAIIGVVAFGLHAVHRVYEVIYSIKDASADILALQHDAKEVGSLLLQLQQSQVLGSAVLPQNADVFVLTNRFKDALSEITSFADKVAEERRDGKVGLRRLQWLLRDGRCAKLRAGMSSLKTSIIAVVAASTSQSVDTVQATMTRLAEAQQQSCNNMDAFKQDHESWFTRQVTDLASFRAIVEERLAAIAHNQDKIFNMLASSPEATRSPDNSLPTLPVTVLMSDVHRCQASVEEQHPNQILDSITVPHISRRLTTGDLPLKCGIRCKCCCHDIRLTRASPYWLAPFFGNLFLPRSFFHRSFSSCSLQTCRRTQKIRQMAKVKFFFPSWFIAVDMKIRLQAFPVHFCLQTPRRVPDTSPIFRCIMRMDIEGLKDLLVSGQASINDLDGDGYGVLHYAASVVSKYSCEQVSQIFQFLVDAGAHIEWEDGEFHLTPLQLLQYYASSRQLRGSDIDSIRTIQLHIAGPIFHEDAIDAWEDWLEKCDFPEIHRAVLVDTSTGPDSSLKNLLASRVADIDVPCRKGFTPLEWSLFMHISNSVEAFLECGADIRKGYPLHGAASCGNTGALETLVRAGVDINQQDARGWTPLHGAAYYGVVDCVKELIRVGGEGLDWGALDHNGRIAIDEARRGLEHVEGQGKSADSHNEVIRVLLDLQTSGSSSGASESGRLNNTTCRRMEAEEEDLKIPGSFSMEYIG